MAEIIDTSGQGEQTEQIPYVTEDIASAAGNAKKAADELFDATKAYESVPYVKNIHDTVNSVLPAVYPVEVGASTGPYIDGLLEKRKELEEVEKSVRAQAIPVKPEDEEGATLAINYWNRFTMSFMGVLFYFEEGLSPDQRW